MNISPVNFKRVAAVRPTDYNTTLADVYLKAGKMAMNVEVTPNTIKTIYPRSRISTFSEFDEKGNMKAQTIYEFDNPVKKFIYYADICRPAAAIDYDSWYKKINEISLYSRHGEETHNFNYKECKASINGKDYTMSKDGLWK